MGVYDVCLELCKERGLKLADLCRDAKVSASTVYKWKKCHEHTPGMDSISALAKALDVKPVALLYPEVKVIDGLYTRNGVPVSSLGDKLQIIIPNAEMTVQECASACGVGNRVLYRWLNNEVNISLVKCEQLAKVLQVPMYVLIDPGAPLRAAGYTEEEVNACSAANLAYSLRVLYGISGKSRAAFAKSIDVTDRVIASLLKGDLPQVKTLCDVAGRAGLSVQELLTDYTTSDAVHDAFCKMTDLQRMKFMMRLKGVTPEYVAKTFSWPVETTFSGRPKSMHIVVPYILACYFQCPTKWFTEEEITLEPGQTLITKWNTII